MTAFGIYNVTAEEGSEEGLALLQGMGHMERKQC